MYAFIKIHAILHQDESTEKRNLHTHKHTHTYTHTHIHTHTHTHTHTYLSNLYVTPKITHPPPPHFPTYNYTLRLNETKIWFIFVKRPLCDIFFYWKYLFLRKKKRKKTAGAKQNQIVEILLNY